MFKNRSGQVRSGWIILIALLSVLIVQNLFAIPGTVLFTIIEMVNNPDSYMTMDMDVMSSLNQYPWITLLVQGGGTAGGILCTWLFWRYLNKKTLLELGFRSSLKGLGFGLFLGAISITAIFSILLITGDIELATDFSSPNFSAFTISFLIMFILVGIFEEMFFRGYVMTTMANRDNQKWVIYLVSALIFSVVHGMNPNVSILGLANIFFVGLLFAYMFDVTKSLWMPIGYHITWNYFQGNVFGFAVSGTSPHGIYNVETVGNELLTGGSFGLEGGILATALIVIGFLATKFYANRQIKE